ncbi:MAG: hypothetical protein NZ524_03565 [Thiobacillaceae bacterium]|nr:hypothetical protein [Thiobacillaceae bacterium]MCX7672611.1 hypothetical protein [Thiobacillaceae bacterium]
MMCMLRRWRQRLLNALASLGLGLAGVSAGGDEEDWLGIGS